MHLILFLIHLCIADDEIPPTWEETHTMRSICDEYYRFDGHYEKQGTHYKLIIDREWYEQTCYDIPDR